MERIIRKLLLLWAVLSSLTATAQTEADNTLQIRLADGTTITLPTSSISDIRFRQSETPSYEGLTGKWLLVASPMGSDDAGGIATTRIDTIRFSATLADDGSCLRCHADTLIIYDGKAISADWTATAETDETSGARRLCWILSSETPVATLSNGQHLYLLSENIQTSRLEGMTLRSDEKSDDEMTFKFPQNQEVYAVLSDDKPFAGSASAFLEIWASARFIHSRR